MTPTRGELLACEAIVRCSRAPRAQQLADLLAAWRNTLPEPTRQETDDDRMDG